MFGMRYIKTQPTTYLMAFRKGKVIAEGAGLSTFYYAPATTLVAVPIASREEPFIFEKTTVDFQSVTIQGHVSYRIADPVKIAGLMNFAVKANGIDYVAKDPEKLSERVIGIVQVLVQQIVQAPPLTDCIRAGAKIANAVALELRRNQEIAALGIDVLGWRFSP